MTRMASTLAAMLITLGVSTAKAQGVAPSTPAQLYMVMTAQSLDETLKDLQSGNKLKNLVAGNGIGCRVFVQHEKDVATSQAEVHDGTDDIFIFLEGTATLTLGGKLESPARTQEGEWRAATITGGKDFKVGKGDVIVVPRGTAHRRITPGQEVTLMVIKSFTAAAR